MFKTDFLNSIREGAIKGYRDFKILPSLTLAQAILESGWGSSRLAKEANNLFGIKAFSDWTDQRIALPTTEWHDNQMETVRTEFRAYGDLNESIEDHNKLLASSRYKAVRDSQDYKTACKMLYECGYATDPNYSQKLIDIIEEHKLYEFDRMDSFCEVAATEISEKVRKFQHICNTIGITDSEGLPLEEDNIPGWRTLSCIVKLPVLSIGSCGALVEYVQEFVNAEPIDGDYGPITRQKVIEYQEKMNIAADGVVGVETWTTLIKS